MKDYEEIKVLIDQEIQKISFPDSPVLLYDPINYIIALKAKRMRPVLVLLAHQLFNKDLNNAIYPAIAIEIFHNFTLLHDDIMDNAPLRRGEPTVHEKWNKNIAILLGDTMLIHAYKIISRVDNSILKHVLDVFSQAAKEVCEGQQKDMEFEGNHAVTLQEYMIMIEKKTAVLLAASLKIGGITAETSLENQDHLYEFGKNIGIAFQLKDDFLDTFGTPKNFGKKVGGDIIANKKTFLYLKTFQLADAEDRKKLKFYYQDNFSEKDKVENVKLIFEKYQVSKHTTDMMKAYYTKAIKHLDAIESLNKEPLIYFANKLMYRIS